MRLTTFCAFFPFLRRARVRELVMDEPLAGLEGSDACGLGLGVGGGRSLQRTSAVSASERGVLAV